MPASPVAVVTDSTPYLPRAMVRERGIHQVSLYVNQGGVITREADMPDFEAFYDGMRTSAELPTTSQPSRPGTTSSRSTYPEGCRAPSSPLGWRPPSSELSDAWRSSTRW
jgi:hypothetical protein